LSATSGQITKERITLWKNRLVTWSFGLHPKTKPPTPPKMQTPLRAMLSDLTTTDEKILDSLHRVGQVHNLALSCDAEGTFVSFDSCGTARDWVGQHVQNLHDKGVLIGRKEDSLVKEYPLFRLNYGLFHIILYVMEGQLSYQNDVWLSTIGGKKAKKTADLWLKKYGLIEKSCTNLVPCVMCNKMVVEKDLRDAFCGDVCV
jgi:hypothetical protein